MDRAVWSEEAYRLEDIPRKITLPCVVQVTKGFLSETEVKSLSDGDIIQLNTEVQIQNVAADVVSDVRPEILFKYFGAEKSDHAQGEWFIPLHYKGNFKVIHETKQYESVNELFRDFPRHAKLSTPLIVAKNDGQKRELPEGTAIELDRMFNKNNDVGHLDMLVLSYKIDGKAEYGHVSLTSVGHFISEEDHNEYTLADIIERYRLPQLVTFIDKKSKDENTTDNIVHATVHLKRLVSRRTLIGQYKHVRNVANRDVNDTQKSLLLLPLDNQMSRKTEVKVLQNGKETLQNVFDDTTAAASDSSLYEDLVHKPDPRTTHAYEDLQKNFNPSIRQEEPKVLVYKPRRPFKTHKTDGEGRGYDISETPGGATAGQGNRSSGSFYSGWKSKFKQALNLKSITRKYFANDEQTENVVLTSIGDKSKQGVSSVYEDIEISDSIENIEVQNVPKQPGNQRGRIKPEHQEQKSGELSTKKQKPFKDLKVDELADRLTACGFHAMAKICHEEHLDGSFFAHESNDFLRKSPFNLDPFEIKKFDRIKEGWIPQL